jgi:hypothetical protein
MGITTAKKRRPKLDLGIPTEVLREFGGRATKEFSRSAAHMTDSEMELARSWMPTQYQGVPVDALRSKWELMRKSGKYPEFNVGGHGPRKGSRIKAKRQTPPKWYRDYTNSDDWKARRIKWLEYWEYRCCTCNTADALLDVHHRTYERIRKEKDNDCVVLCRRCHDLFELEVPTDSRQLF